MNIFFDTGECKLCSKSFSKTYSHKKFCSRICKIKHYNLNKDKVLERQRVNANYHKHKLRNSYRYRAYIKGAEVRDIKFLLTREEFDSIYGNPCLYCGRKYDKMGIDRVDSSLPYIMSNVVSACTACNIGKREMPKGDFITMCKMVAEKHK